MTGPTETRAKVYLGFAAISVAAVLWGSTGVAVRIIAQRSGLSPITITFFRLAVSGVAISAGIGPHGWNRQIAGVRSSPLTLLGASVGLATYLALSYIGVQDVGVSISTLASAGLAPIGLTAVAAIRRRRWPHTRQCATVAVAVVGLLLITVRPGSGPAGHPDIGLAVSFLGGLAFVWSTLLYQRMAIDGSPLLLTGTTSTVGAVVLLPFAAMSGLYWPSDLVSSMWLLYMGVAATIGGYLLYFYGVRTVSTEATGVLTVLDPLAATALAALVVHEPLGLLAQVGAGLMLSAIGSLYLRVSHVDVVDSSD